MGAGLHVARCAWRRGRHHTSTTDDVNAFMALLGSQPARGAHVENCVGGGRPMPTTQRVRSTLATMTALTGPGGTTDGGVSSKPLKLAGIKKWHASCSIPSRRCPAAYCFDFFLLRPGTRLFYLAWGIRPNHFTDNGATGWADSPRCSNSRFSLSRVARPRRGQFAGPPFFLRAVESYFLTGSGPYPSFSCLSAKAEPFRGVPPSGVSASSLLCFSCVDFL